MTHHELGNAVSVQVAGSHVVDRRFPCEHPQRVAVRVNQGRFLPPVSATIQELESAVAIDIDEVHIRDV
ncbi:MAG: hypothetical protein U0992_02815 [Planctomycetaceae bacterium]